MTTKDETLTGYLFDLNYYFRKEDYLRAAQCAACLLIELAKRADVKPSKLIKQYSK